MSVRRIFQIQQANSMKMSKRMEYSVVGLPHYTIWHLYEPSVDDIRHMEEMEAERVQSETTTTENTKDGDETKADSSSEQSPQAQADSTDMKKYEESAAQKEKEVEKGKQEGQDAE